MLRVVTCLDGPRGGTKLHSFPVRSSHDWCAHGRMAVGVRLFKTRTLAKKARDPGRILSNGQAAKAAREVRVGDRSRVTNDDGDFEIEVRGLSEIRGPAVEA